MNKIFSAIILIFLFALVLVFPSKYALADPTSATIPSKLASPLISAAGSPTGTAASESSGGIPLPSDKPTNLPTNIQLTGKNSIIKKAFDIIVSVGEVAFIIMLLVGGVMYITSGGEEGATKARKLILNAVIGIVILLSAWAIATWVIETLQKTGG